MNPKSLNFIYLQVSKVSQFSPDLLIPMYIISTLNIIYLNVGLYLHSHTQNTQKRSFKNIYIYAKVLKLK